MDATKDYSKRRGLYFLKDKKAQIYKLYNMGKDADGFKMGLAYVAVAKSPLWCYTRQLSADQMFYSTGMGTKEDRLFVFNYRDDVEQYDRIIYNDKVYSITRTDTQDDNKGELFVYASGDGEPNDPDEMNLYEYGTDTSHWKRTK